jgi:hypothetical protein
MFCIVKGTHAVAERGLYLLGTFVLKMEPEYHYPIIVRVMNEVLRSGIYSSLLCILGFVSLSLKETCPLISLEIALEFKAFSNTVLRT